METETAETETMMGEEGLATAEQFEALPFVEHGPPLANEAQEPADMLETKAEESRPIEERIRENAAEYKGGEHWQVTYQSAERYAHDEETNEVLNARTGESLTKRELESGDPARIALMQDIMQRIETGEHGFTRLDDYQEYNGDETTIHVTYVIIGEDREVSYLILSTTVRITGEEGSIELTEANGQHLPFLWERETDEHATEIRSADVEPLVYTEAVIASDTEETGSESEEIARTEVMGATSDIKTLRADEAVIIETPPLAEAHSEKSEVTGTEMPPQETRALIPENNEVTRPTDTEEARPTTMRNTAHTERKAEGVVYTPVETRAEIKPAMLKELLASEAPPVADHAEENVHAFVEPRPITQATSEPKRADTEHHNAVQTHSPEERMHEEEPVLTTNREETEPIVNEAAPIRVTTSAIERMPNEIRTTESVPQTEKKSGEENIVVNEQKRTITEVPNTRPIVDEIMPIRITVPAEHMSSEIRIEPAAQSEKENNEEKNVVSERERTIDEVLNIRSEITAPEDISAPVQENARATERHKEQQPIFQSVDVLRELDIPLPIPETPNAIETIRSGTPHTAHAKASDTDEDKLSPIPTPIAERNGIRMFAVSGR